jgi:hypothetical protein
MGALIQTKGTQRLAKFFNQRFDGSQTGLSFIRSTTRAGGTKLTDDFDNTTGKNSLLKLSDLYIAQNATTAGTTWPQDGNDLLYPFSATMVPTNPGNAVSPLIIAVGGSKLPDAIKVGSTVSNLTVRSNIPSGTTVGTVVAGAAANTFNVTLFDTAGNPLPVNVGAKDKINFATGKHERLVRRWRWYLKNDLLDQNDNAIRSAISAALDDPSISMIIFQSAEDTQSVLVTTQQKLNNATDELGDEIDMYILLLTQSTTAPERLDPQ